MATCCAGCSILQLPAVADFEGRTKVSRALHFECWCSVSPDNITQAVFRERISTLQPEIWVRSASSQFCGNCDFCKLVFEALAQRYGTAIETSIQELRDRTPAGTHKQYFWLGLTLRMINFHLITGNHEIDGSVTQYSGISLLELQGTVDIYFDIAKGTPAEQSIGLILPLEIFADRELWAMNQTSAVHRHGIEASAMSPNNLDKIKRWLEHCTQEHVSCSTRCEERELDNYHNQRRGSAFVPKRLVYVGNPLAGEDPKIVLGSEVPKDGSLQAGAVHYAALSYCWGSVEERQTSLVSNTANINDWTNAIPWAMIPLAFQDFIILVLELGLHYVWIDSLCILQGEGGDWMEESAKMWSIFSNSFVTVIAAAAPSPQFGFLNRPSSSSCKISSVEPHGSFCLRARPGAKWWGTDRMAEITGKRWITRGWTYQEERLSRRVLMFGENKFFFDCRERERCEDTDVWYYRPSWSRIVYEDDDITVGDVRPATIIQSRKKIFDHWQWLCVQYSHRKLTFPEDKLPAFSGVSAAVASKVHSRYLAGLWEANLLHDLFWDTVGVAKKSPIYRAPSWSWASLDTESIIWGRPRTCLGQECQLYCELLQAETALTGPNLFGAINDAFLKLKCHVLSVELGYSHGGDKMSYPWTVMHQEIDLGKGKLDLHEDRPGNTNDDMMGALALLISTCGTGHTATRGLLLNRTGRTRDGHVVLTRAGTFYVPAETPFELRQKLAFWKRELTTIYVLE